ncbi:MAG: aspartate kinase [Bacteroidota bacterium]
MYVLKFGGSSMSSPDSIRRISKILLDRKDQQLLVVVSAYGGITNQLLEVGQLASTGDPTYRTYLQEIRDRHLKSIIELVQPSLVSGCEEEVKKMLNLLEEKAYGVYLLKELSLKTRDELVSFGERLAAQIFSCHLSSIGLESKLLDPALFIKTDDQFGCAKVFRDLTSKNISELELSPQCSVSPGFIGSNKDGDITTLGRGGSDLSASLYAHGLGAKQLEKWTDVTGMMTCDPRIVPSAKPIDNLSYWEAMELCHFGAKVIYPPTLVPLLEKDIPMYVKNTFHPKDAGTLISSNIVDNNDAVRGLSSIGGMSLITLSGSGMVGVPGFSRRLFTALSYNKINVSLITQASSEHSITVGVEDDLISSAKNVIEEEFEMDLARGTLNPISHVDSLSIIALVGDQMKNHTGISGKAFHTLGRNGINIIAIAQGSSERNISIVIESKHVSKGLRALHETFFDLEPKQVNVFAIGVGNVGGTLLEQIRTQKDHLLESQNIEINVIGLSNSKKMIIDPEGLDLSNWKELLDKSELRASTSESINKLDELNLRNCVMVDNTANDLIAESYPKFLERSIGVVASNKIAAAQPMEGLVRVLQSLSWRRHKLNQSGLGCRAGEWREE